MANAINNVPIALGNTPSDVESIDLLTPNRLMLARNNSRCPVGTVDISDDPKKIVFKNNEVFKTWWLKTWLVSYVPTLILRPKWYDSSRDPKVGDVILFLKSFNPTFFLFSGNVFLKNVVLRIGFWLDLEVR